MLTIDFVRIGPDKELIEKISIKCKLFFEKAILPEFLAKLFSKSTITNAASLERVYYCTMSEKEDDLIGCDDINCQIKRFHLKCLRITKIPRGFAQNVEKQKTKK